MWIGADQRHGEELVSTDPGNPDRVVATAGKATPGDVDAALDAARRGAKGVGRDAGPRARGHAAAGRPVAARAATGGGRAGGARVREAVARGRRGRLRGDRLPRVLRPRRGGHRPGRPAAAGARRAQHDGLQPARRGRRHLAVELPARDPARDGRRGPGHRQRRCAQAGRAVARLRADGLPGAARGRRPGRRGLAAARRGRRRRGARQGPARAHDRLHGLGRGRPGDRQARPRRCARARTTSSA